MTTPTYLVSTPQHLPLPNKQPNLGYPTISPKVYRLTISRPNRGSKTAPSEMFREQFWPRNRPFWTVAGNDLNHQVIKSSNHWIIRSDSPHLFLTSHDSAPIWKPLNSELDMWMDLRILDDSILFPAAIQNGRFLGQNCSRNISDGVVLTPLFGPACWQIWYLIWISNHFQKDWHYADHHSCFNFILQNGNTQQNDTYWVEIC